MNKKILLVSISKLKSYSNTGIDMLCGYLRKKNFLVDVKYFHNKENYMEIMQSLSMEYDIYGFSVYSSNYLSFDQMTRDIKLNFPKKIIVWGGSFPTMFYKDIFKHNKLIDYIILGDGEQPMEYLISNLCNYGNSINHPSIATPADFVVKRINYNETITHLPSWDYYEYMMPDFNKYKIHCIQSKNNICTGVCSFCFERKGKVCYKSIDLIVKEIQYITSKFGVKKIYFTDDNLLDANGEIAKNRTRLLCTALKQINRKIIFTCYIKAISFRDTSSDHELLQLMSDTGFKTMFIGIESGSETDLKLYNKLTTVEDNYRIIKLLRMHGIVPLVGFINLNPYSTLATLKENFYFLQRIHSTNLFSYALSRLNIYKYTDIYYKAYKDRLLKPTFNIINDLDYYFKDRDVKRIVDFIDESLKPILAKIKYEAAWLLGRCEEALYVNQDAHILKEQLLDIQKNDYKIISDFFYVLYVKNNLNEAGEMLDKFAQHFFLEQECLKRISIAIGDIVSDN